MEDCQVNAYLKNNKNAKDFASKCASRGSKDPDALSLSARVWITMRDSEKRWFKRSEDLLEKALKRDKDHEGRNIGSEYIYIIINLKKLRITLEQW